jgi:hypothetical protein
MAPDALGRRLFFAALPRGNQRRVERTGCGGRLR